MFMPEMLKKLKFKIKNVKLKTQISLSHCCFFSLSQFTFSNNF